MGLALAKPVFPVHGVDGRGEVGVRRQRTRGHMLPRVARLSPRLLGLEAWATAHDWARLRQALPRLLADELMRSWRADLHQGPRHDGSRKADYIDAVSTPWSFARRTLAPPGEAI